jgi:CheY-like chemotaxis protein
MCRSGLTVDDEEVIRKCLRLRLLPWGYEVSEAMDGGKALNQLSKGDVDLMICDIEIAKMTEVRNETRITLQPEMKHSTRNPRRWRLHGYYSTKNSLR